MIYRYVNQKWLPWRQKCFEYYCGCLKISIIEMLRYKDIEITNCLYNVLRKKGVMEIVIFWMFQSDVTITCLNFLEWFLDFNSWREKK